MKYNLGHSELGLIYLGLCEVESKSSEDMKQALVIPLKKIIAREMQVAGAEESALCGKIMLAIRRDGCVSIESRQFSHIPEEVFLRAVHKLMDDGKIVHKKCAYWLVS